jgi:hypothetical protein
MAPESDFVSSIVSDPRNVPDVMRLYGYPGASSEEDHERLYLNLDLTNYVEVPTKAILYRMTDQDPQGAVCWWTKKDAALIYKMTPAAQALAHYFAGAIQAGMAGAAAPPVAGAAPPTVFCQTPPVTFLCQRPTVWCHTPACTFAGPACMSAVCPTRYPTCALHCTWNYTQFISCVALCRTQVCEFEGPAGFARRANWETRYVTCGEYCQFPSEIPGQTCNPAGCPGGFAPRAMQVADTRYITCGEYCVIPSEIPGQTCAPAGGCGPGWQAGFQARFSTAIPEACRGTLRCEI